MLQNQKAKSPLYTYRTLAWRRMIAMTATSVLCIGCSFLASSPKHMQVELESKGQGSGQNLIMSLRTTFADGSVEDYGSEEMLVATVQVDAVDGQNVKARMFMPSVPIVDSTVVLIVGGYRVESLQLMSFVWDFVRLGRITVVPVQRGTDLNSSLPVTYGVLEVDDIRSVVSTVMESLQREQIHVDVIACSSGGNIALAALAGLNPRVRIRNLVIESPVNDVDVALQATSLYSKDRERIQELMNSRKVVARDFNLTTLAETIKPMSYLLVRGEQDEVISESAFRGLVVDLQHRWGAGQLKRLTCGRHNMRVVDPCPLEAVRSQDRAVVSFVQQGRNE